jgi:hypothetical protein
MFRAYFVFIPCCTRCTRLTAFVNNITLITAKRNIRRLKHLVCHRRILYYYHLFRLSILFSLRTEVVCYLCATGSVHRRTAAGTDVQGLQSPLPCNYVRIQCVCSSVDLLLKSKILTLYSSKCQKVNGW